MDVRTRLHIVPHPTRHTYRDCCWKWFIVMYYVLSYRYYYKQSAKHGMEKGACRFVCATAPFCEEGLFILFSLPVFWQ